MWPIIFFFNKIPHYQLKEATEVLKPILGQFYRYDQTPFWTAYFIAQKECRHVADDGTILTYQEQQQAANYCDK